MAKIYKTDGTKEDVFPKENGKFSLEEMQEIVGGCIIEMIDLPSGMVMVLNEEGKLEGLEKNEVATQILKREFPNNNDELVVGNVLLTDPEFIEE